MKSPVRNIITSAFLSMVVAAVASAQVATGTPPFNSFGGGPFDVVNLGNLNMHFSIPVVHKPGRGTSFTYDLSYDNAIWQDVSINGTQSWQPTGNFGWTSQTQAKTGYLSFWSNSGTGCSQYGGTWYTESRYVYNDAFGASHPISGAGYSDVCGHISETNGVANDGSGYSLTIQYPSHIITDRSGKKFNVPLNTTTGSATVSDANGNSFSVNGSGQFFDTLSSTTPVLTVSGAGTPSSPTTFTYTAPSGASASYTMHYTQFTVATDFQWSGIAEYPPTSKALVTSVTLPDGTAYTFGYEATTGSCTPLSGTYSANCVTARINEVQLPTGGTIAYTYRGASHNYINPDGTTGALTRTVSSAVTAPSQTWLYDRSPLGTNLFSTTITDPNNNQTVIDFSEDANTTSPTYSYYETQRQVYQGSAASGSLLRTSTKCYNGNYTSCSSAAVTSPISQVDSYTQLPNGKTRLSTIQYNGSFSGSGLVSDDKEYGYGVSLGAAPASTYLVSETAISYASLGNGILNKPSAVTVTDWSTGTAKTLSQSTYGYDQTAVTATTGTPQHIAISGSRGNLTTLTMSTTSTTSLSKTFTYYDTGTPYAATDVNGAQTTYVYGSGSCGNSFATTINEPLSLSRSITWNCTGGVPIQVTDENGQNVTSNYSDPDFWRPADMIDQANNQTNVSYIGQTAAEATLQNFNGGNSASDSRTTIDGFGRTVFTQRKQGPTSANYDTVETDYNNMGRPYRTTMPYTAVASPSIQNTTAPATTTTYDALGRVLTVQDANGGTVSYTYTNNDVLQTVSGSQAFKKQFEYDGLGRLSSVCEISSTLPLNGSCGQSTSQTGLLTTYKYDALGHILSVVQNAQATTANQQTRNFSYDMLGRVTSETNPESGTKTYVYDTDPSMCGNGASTMNGDLVKTTDAVGNCVMYYHDALHRVTDIGNNNQGTSHCRRFRYDNSPGYGGSTKPAGLTNTLGRLIEAATDYCSGSNDSLLTDEWFSYSKRGELTDVYELTPHSGSYYHTTTSYWPTGSAQSLSGIPGVPTIYYGASDGSGLDSEGRVTKVTAASGANPVTSVTYSPGTSTAPLGYLTAVTFGSADSDGFTYDVNTGRMKTYTFTMNGKNDTGTLTWNTNGTLYSLAINDQIPGTADSQTCYYVYDDIQRLSSATCGSIWTQTFTYDSFGNIKKSGNSAFNPVYSPTTNQFTSIPGVTVKYDLNGDLLTDNLNTYTWDVFGQMLTVTNGSTTVTSTYDALGRMVENNSGGSFSEFLYGPTGTKLAKMSGQTLTKAFIALPGGAKAIYNSSGLAYYRHSDWLGSSRLTSTASRALYSSTAYAPFGEQYGTSGTPDPSFTGQDQDTISSLYDFPARRQSPTQGRWISPDPAGRGAVSLTNPQSWNRYAYVYNNPMRLIDAMGMSVGHRRRLRAMEDDPSTEGGGDDGGGGGGGGDGGDGSDGVGDNGGPGIDPGCPDENCVTVTADAPDDVQTQDSAVNPCTTIFGGVNNGPGDPGFGQAAAETNGDVFFPLSGSGAFEGAVNAATAGGLMSSNNARQVANTINSLYSSGNTSITLYLFSGSAGLFEQAWDDPQMIDPAAKAAISQVFFVEPGGMFNAGSDFGNLAAQSFIGIGALDFAVQASNGGDRTDPATIYPGGAPTVINAPHSFQQSWNTPQLQATIPLSTPCLGSIDNENLPVPERWKKEDMLVARMSNLKSKHLLECSNKKFEGLFLTSDPKMNSGRVLWF